MTSHARPRLRRFPMALRLVALLLMGFAAGGLVVEPTQLLHLHKDESPGVYNEQHVLATLLGTPSSGVPLPEASILAFLVALIGLVTHRDGERLGVPVRQHAAPRAPPAR